MLRNQNQTLNFENLLRLCARWMKRKSSLIGLLSASFNRPQNAMQENWIFWWFEMLWKKTETIVNAHRTCTNSTCTQLHTKFFSLVTSTFPIFRFVHCAFAQCPLLSCINGEQKNLSRWGRETVRNMWTKPMHQNMHSLHPNYTYK